MKNIVIYGASGHAKMIVDIVNSQSQYNIVGFIDTYKPQNTIIYDYPILGSLDLIPILIQTHNVKGVIIAIGDNYSRRQVYESIRNVSSNLEFINTIHPSAIIAESVKIKEGTVIMPNVVVNADSKIGRFCILNTASILGHDSEMGDFSSLASRATVAGNVTIGLCSVISLGASVIQGISIGDNTVIGAGSLVLNSIGDYKQAFGNPINRIKIRNADSQYLGHKK